MNRRVGGPTSSTSLDEAPTIWKSSSIGDNQNMLSGSGIGVASCSGTNSVTGVNADVSSVINQGTFGQSSITYGATAAAGFQQTGQSSPAGGQPIIYPSAPQTGSNTPQYTSSPAPSGSSTPGPGPSPNVSLSFPQPQPSGPMSFNGPGVSGGSFGSPTATVGSVPYGRPGSSGPAFGVNQGGIFSSSGITGGFNLATGSAQFGTLISASSFLHAPGSTGHAIVGGPPPIERTDQNLRRHNSYFSHTEHRIFELNKRLQQRTDESDNCWWDSFTTEFFEDDARLTILFCLEDGPKRYTIGRTLIPRFFRSIFDGGVSDLYFQLKHAKESFHNTSVTLDCDNCTVMTQHGKPFYTKVCADARLILEFIYDDYMRIKSWHMTIKGHRELIPRSVIGTSIPMDPMVLEQLTKNVTRAGITNSTLNYLRLCVILEPMQELMSRHKAYALSPRDCLKTTLFQKWQRMVAPPGKKDPQRPANKRRKRKGSNSGGITGSNTPPVTNQKRSPSGASFSLASQDVMVVGEPTLMGGEFGEEDERLITRLENTQYDAAGIMDHDSHPGFGHTDSGSNPWNVVPLSPGGNQPNTSNSDVDKKSPVIV